MSELDDLVFKGVDGTECEDFVHAVKVQARKHNKLRDERWILDLAEASLKGDALRWFIKLDPAIRSNWDLLQEALIDRFPASKSEESSQSSTIPTPPAAIGIPPILDTESGLLRPNLRGTTLSGRIRIISNVQSVGRYVSASFSNYKTLTITNDPKEALLVRFTPSYEPFGIQVLVRNPSVSYDWLAVSSVWHTAKCEMWFGTITTSSHPALTPLQAYQHADYTVQSAIWTLIFDGTLIPTWKDKGKRNYLAVAANISRSRILVTKDLSKTTADLKLTDSYCPVRLVFEPGV